MNLITLFALLPLGFAQTLPEHAASYLDHMNFQDCEVSYHLQDDTLALAVTKGEKQVEATLNLENATFGHFDFLKSIRYFTEVSFDTFSAEKERLYFYSTKDGILSFELATAEEGVYCRSYLYND